MFRKVLVTGMAVAMILSMTACGSSKKQENMQVQDVQKEEQQDIVQGSDEQWTENEETEDFVEDEVGADPLAICNLYFAYLTGDISEEEISEELEMWGVSLEEAASLYEERAEDLGFSAEEIDLAQTVKHFEAMDEIKNASMRQFKFQVADMILGLYTSVADCMAQVENSELPFTYEYNPDKLMSLNDGPEIKIYLADELYMTLWTAAAPRNSETTDTRPLKECVVYIIELEDYSNVYYAGGIPAMGSGISLQEYDELMQKEFADIMDDIRRGEQSQSDNFYVAYSFSVPTHYVLECGGAAKPCSDYTYQAYFDETGTSLERLELNHNDGITVGRVGGVRDDDIIIER